MYQKLRAVSVAMLLFGVFLVPRAGAQTQDVDVWAHVPPSLQDLQIGILAGGTYDIGKGHQDWNDLYYDTTLFFDYEHDFFFVSAAIGFTNQGKFIGEPIYGDNWWDIHEGLIGIDYKEFYFTGGYHTLQDRIDSPFSLYINSNPSPLPTVGFSYEGEHVFVSTQWAGLNELSGSTYNFDDRGMNYRTFGVKFAEHFTLGYQESIVYTGQVFNPLYFFVPVPVQITQLIYSTPGSPRETEPDPNGLIGVFLEYNDDTHYSFLQFLFDDIQPIRAPDEFAQKLAWSAGYSYDSPVGRFGFYHAGATKYAFANLRPTNVYPYTYFPTAQYENNRSETKTLWYFDNYIGYKHGENNLAFRVEYENRFFDTWDVDLGLEYVVSGSKAPADPWHELSSSPLQTVILDETLLEHTILLNLSTNIDVLHGIVNVILDLSTGYVFNELELTNNPNEASMGFSIFKPSDTSRFLFQAFVGVQVFYNRFTPEWRKRHGHKQKRW